MRADGKKMVLEVIIFAFLSTLSRSGLNILDRINIGIRKSSIHEVMLQNNVLPAFIGIIGATAFGLFIPVVGSFLNWNSLVFSMIVQLVAYAISVSFKKHNVEDVVVASKLSDLFISIIYFLPIYSSIKNYSVDIVFSAITSIICIIYLIKIDSYQSLILVIFSLIFQAVLTPFILPKAGPNLVMESIIFSIATMLWRSIFSFIFYIKNDKFLIRNMFPSFLIIYRAALAISTQIFLVLAISIDSGPITWSILNMTGVFSILLSVALFKIKFSIIKYIYLVAIVLITIFRSLYPFFLIM